MNAERIAAVCVAGLFAIGLLSACNLASPAADQANQGDAVTTATDVAATSAPAVRSSPSAIPAKAQPTAVPTIKQTNTAKPIATGTPAAKQPPAASSKPPTPTVSAVQSNARKQGDDLEQQINQLLNDVDRTDTVDDASQ